MFCMLFLIVCVLLCFFFSSRRRHTRCALVTGVQTCALPICVPQRIGAERLLAFRGLMHLPVEPDITPVAVGEERRSELRMIERARHDDALRLGAARHADAAERLGPCATRSLDRAVEIPGGNLLRQRVARALQERKSTRLNSSH